MILIFATPTEARELLGLSRPTKTRIVRPQTSGICVHYDEMAARVADIDPCTYSYDDGRCPHLDNPEILCPVKDACSAMSEVARMQEACEVEREAPAAEETVYETETPEFVEPTPEEEPVYEASPLAEGRHLDPREWTPEQERAMCGATTPAEAVALYRAAYPGSSRTDAAIKTRYHLKIRPRRHGADGPLPDFAGDTVPVTQCEEPASKGLYGDARALHADMMDGMMCDRPLTPEPETPPETQERESTRHPWIGMHVRVLDPLDLANRTGTVVQYNPDSPEMLVALDNSLDRIWLPPESLVLVGAGGGSP